MDHTLFEKVEQWVAEHGNDLVQSGLKVEFVLGKPSSKRGGHLDINSKTYVATAAFWESMELELEAWDVGRGEQVITEYYRPQDAGEAIKVISDFLYRLSHGIGRE
jgi:hypothetical protein